MCFCTSLHFLAIGMTGEFSDPKKADVYVTRDGGYNWKKVRVGGQSLLGLRVRM